MHILIIGHTSGIGFDIFRSLSKYNDVSGVSKSTGFDISTNISKTYDYSEFDVIILNAVGLKFGSQIDTFFNIVESETFNKDSLVIVMSSASAFKESSNTVDKVKYSTEKNALNKASRNLNNLGYNTSVICPSYVDTEWNKDKDVLKLDVSDVTKSVYTVLDSFENGVLIGQIVVKKIKKGNI